VTDLSQNAVANLGWTDITMPVPVFVGDTIHSRSEILALRRSKSRPDVGIVDVRTEGTNQRDEVVIAFKRTIMVYTRAARPKRS